MSRKSEIQFHDSLVELFPRSCRNEMPTFHIEMKKMCFSSQFICGQFYLFNFTDHLQFFLKDSTAWKKGEDSKSMVSSFVEMILGRLFCKTTTVFNLNRSLTICSCFPHWGTNDSQLRKKKNHCRAFFLFVWD